mmetsp:Transcript_29008/g.39198  ORF Transcript_29008/g.39198 Transcript_29008/m.39198 type:complete len:316 (+) Transcript_29008:265-1212(+)
MTRKVDHVHCDATLFQCCLQSSAVLLVVVANDEVVWIDGKAIARQQACRLHRGLHQVPLLQSLRQSVHKGLLAHDGQALARDREAAVQVQEVLPKPHSLHRVALRLQHAPEPLDAKDAGADCCVHRVADEDVAAREHHAVAPLQRQSALLAVSRLHDRGHVGGRHLEPARPRAWDPLAEEAPAAEQVTAAEGSARRQLDDAAADHKHGVPAERLSVPVHDPLPAEGHRHQLVGNLGWAVDLDLELVQDGDQRRVLLLQSLILADVAVVLSCVLPHGLGLINRQDLQRSFAPVHLQEIRHACDPEPNDHFGQFPIL